MSSSFSLLTYQLSVSLPSVFSVCQYFPFTNVFNVFRLSMFSDIFRFPCATQSKHVRQIFHIPKDLNEQPGVDSLIHGFSDSLIHSFLRRLIRCLPAAVLLAISSNSSKLHYTHRMRSVISVSSLHHSRVTY